MSNPHGLNDTQVRSPQPAPSTNAEAAIAAEYERRAVLLAAVQDRAAERNLLADRVGAALGSDDLGDSAQAAAIDDAMELVADAARALHDARRKAVEAAIPDDDIQAAYATGSMGIRSSDNPAIIAQLAADRDRVAFDTTTLHAENRRAQHIVDIERTQRIAAGKQVEELREQLARVQQAGETGLDAIFREWQADTEAVVATRFRSRPQDPERAALVGAGSGAGPMTYTAAIEVTQPGASGPVRLRPSSDLFSEVQTAEWVRSQLLVLGCDLTAHVRITAQASDADRTVALIESAGYPHVVDEDTDRWHRQVKDARAHHTAGTNPADTEMVAAPSAAQLLSASFEESEPAPWVNDNGVITAAPAQLPQTFAAPLEVEPGQ
ncbi:MAG: hypothetical protein J2P17_00055 [Mycobacterium sp.]|nr:hypothetical protein [Mycobacterium sp.]